MKTKLILSILCLLAIACITTSCDEDDAPTASIEGAWQGDKTEIKGYVDGIPVAVYDETDEEFDDEVIFEADGTLTVTIDGTETAGVWEWVEKNKKIAITADFGIEYLDQTEVFTVETLSATKLTLYLEKDDTIEDPDSGMTVSGTIKASLYFVKSS